MSSLRPSFDSTKVEDCNFGHTYQRGLPYLLLAALCVHFVLHFLVRLSLFGLPFLLDVFREQATFVLRKSKQFLNAAHV